ncbi:hypothetical protein BCR41DRAFT_394785 [Lobosporangium transversale]|uniref:Uncharacterized protein n=1 Tax=Lobosporangium transversale TaxID=64571 RepID=A0A1Y2GU52_9FUNG|nr:hypothetical protein BCR41DRAFT_394785 [Lobosporangium transversale]ORZ20874.1 hypothetical protein BCR41DRAFT_394785 [Lobosporangium transversale]|eukprot:XP_021882783.1 hypothetical protein BCR41DRAFT_394785 [Lobosporangium transversale]
MSLDDSTPFQNEIYLAIPQAWQMSEPSEHIHDTIQHQHQPRLKEDSDQRYYSLELFIILLTIFSSLPTAIFLAWIVTWSAAILSEFEPETWGRGATRTSFSGG